MYIYVATSWRNMHHARVLDLCRATGNTVYDFKNPGKDDYGFSWKEIDNGWEGWTPSQYRDALNSAQAIRGYANDKKALDSCSACLMILPSGRSASWELGYMFGRKKKCLVYMPKKVEPELMYREHTILVNEIELVSKLHEMGNEL